MLEKYLDFNSDLNNQNDILNQGVFEIASNINKKKEEIVNKQLIKKGFPPLTEFFKKERFPRISVSKQGDWEYYFADNNTINGVFLCALKVEFNNAFDIQENKVSASITLHFQDTDCSSVLL
jgi:hypothetical protein